MILKPVSDIFKNSPEFRELKKFNRAEGPVQEQVSIEGISPSSFPLIVSALFNDSPGQYLVVTENSQKMQELQLDLSCMVDEQYLFTLPPWETLPYEFVSPPEKIERERVTSLYRLLNKQSGIIVTTVESLIRKLPPGGFLINRGMCMNVNEDYPFDDLIDMLVSYGYSREPRIEAFGQFSVKGGIIDVFLPTCENPIRFDFFGDTLESIRIFDPWSQVSISGLDSVTIYPRKELTLFQKERESLSARILEAASQGMNVPEELLTQANDGTLSDVRGIEDLFPLATGSETLLSYLDASCGIIFIETPSLISKKNELEKMFNGLYSKKKSSTLCLEPGELLAPVALSDASQRALHLQVFTSTAGALQWKLRSVAGFHGRINSVRDEIRNRLEQGWKIIITTGFEGQARRLYDLLGEFNPSSSFEELDPDSRFSILITPLTLGLEIIECRVLIISDHEIFGKSYRKKKHFKKKETRPIDTFLDLRTGDYVVHINHGIGTFSGIERMTAGGVERDFLMIEYADSDRLYVPLDQITLVQKYIGTEGKKPRIDYLGRKSAWNRIREKVRESVEETARELLAIYAQRRALKGFQYPADTLWQEEFESLFEFEETPDQITAIEDVKDDMENPRPMDRLICGDVGFGKTEVAIRASFKAVMAGRQVSILVPTTVLGMQHFNTFSKRFADYPMTVEMVSRFRTAQEIREIKKKLAEGEIDIIIGTHALLASDISFRNLGLLIIDEEQRFGVKHKEKLKKYRALVDVITLSATPIPRTLHMSMAGIRDLSIIATPPENRQAIETYVMEENPDILRMAVMRELDRNGQVFYVHNRVQTIEAQAEMLMKLVPEATIGIAHGQMDETELEQVMVDFINARYDILVSTTIIESGLDMPNINTIIINRADTFGMSQLYQLKGRVGRSSRKAYAYLFYPIHIPLTEEAQKRLQVIAEYTELGSGFKIAMKDLEIRGAGNILGREQSGNIMEVGFELYIQMLDDAIRNLKGEKPHSMFRTPVFLNTDVFIPDGYMPDERQKIEFYKRFESCETSDEIDLIEKELADRFGPVPVEVKRLIELERIRTLASALAIDEIIEDSRVIRIKISGESQVDTARIVSQIKTDRRFTLDRSDSEVLLFNPGKIEIEKKLSELKKWLQQIS